jgi:hypothetical protein
MKTSAKRLGRIAALARPTSLMFRAFAPALSKPPPARTAFWRRRAPFPNRTFGNDDYGDCTFASQANMFRRFERLERGRTIDIHDQEVVDKYLACTSRLYGGGDTGAYEEDALSCSRSEDTCLRDAQGHPLLIDAYVKVDPHDVNAMKWAVAGAAGHGIKVCLALPNAFQQLDPPAAWDIPANQLPKGQWEPNSWGGHSMFAVDYDERGITLERTWMGGDLQLITWRAWLIFGDEAHVVIDSVDAWRKKSIVKSGGLDLAGIVKAVNKVSRTKIK